MRAEVAKLRYLPFPRWTAVLVVAAVVVMGIALLVVAPTNPEKYVDVPNTAIGLIASLTALVFGVWMSTLEFSSGTLQRTLTAEPDRNRVLTSKLVITLVIAVVAGLAIAAAAGGLSHLAAVHAKVAIDEDELAGALFGSVPEWTAYATIGFAFGLLSRSLGGGIALGLIFVLAFDGFLSYIPGVADYTFGQLTQDLTNGISGDGGTKNGLGVAVVGTLAWCVVLLVPGWVRFSRGDLK